MSYFNNLYSILKQLDPKRFVFIMILMIGASILEFIGISLIVPFIAILTEQKTSFLNYLPDKSSEIFFSLSKEEIFVYESFYFF